MSTAQQPIYWWAKREDFSRRQVAGCTRPVPFNAFGLFNYLNGQEQEDEKEKRLLLMKGVQLNEPFSAFAFSWDPFYIITGERDCSASVCWCMCTGKIDEMKKEEKNGWIMQSTGFSLSLSVAAAVAAAAAAVKLFFFFSFSP